MIERVAWTYRCVYAPSHDRSKCEAQWVDLSDHFQDRGVHVESMKTGIFCVAAPPHINLEQIEEIANSCPVPVMGILDPEEHDYFQDHSLHEQSETLDE